MKKQWAKITCLPANKTLFSSAVSRKLEQHFLWLNRTLEPRLLTTSRVLTCKEWLKIRQRILVLEEEHLCQALYPNSGCTKFGFKYDAGSSDCTDLFGYASWLLLQCEWTRVERKHRCFNWVCAWWWNFFAFAKRTIMDSRDLILFFVTFLS